MAGKVPPQFIKKAAAPKKDNESKMEKDSTDDAIDRKNVAKVLTKAGVTGDAKKQALAYWDKLDD